jgi:protein arginine N-methyltransferase 1
VLKEPLVDIVNANAVATRPQTVKEINLLTATKQDLTFSVPFALTAHRDDYIHAFIAWFDIGFEACHKPVRFSTGPDAKPTHWKQTVFYTPSMIVVNKDETITGTLSCTPNAKNPRDLDIAIEYRFEGRDCSATERVAYNMK